MTNIEVNNTIGRVWTNLTRLLLQDGGNRESLKLAVDVTAANVRVEKSDLKSDLLYYVFAAGIEHLLNLGISKEELTTEFNFNVHTVYDLLHPEAKEAN